ncbi:glycosyl transferase family 2 [Rippkaea orientalis PCC 8801]|uniref:Glycosyl transferase family 2 n=1 Tax=Rippkaea orientalis (strain PCC 8801 / RF-1) TaxID=41431 RepID=B7K2E5_RIPO1|nr:glycosyltransferase [Rippkaea orientalis]ACK65281.1 glycosyl transferase family 2 [Rippkaea orientalis PCC 8801]
MTPMSNQTEPLSKTPIFCPKVSVIVPIYNGERDIPDLIDCLRSQTYPKDRIEYLLVNNNSSDRTLEMLNQAATEATQEGVNLTILEENEIQSSYAARNEGIRHAIGEICVFTDADCRPCSDWVKELVQPFSDPKIGIVAGELTALPGKSLWEKYAERYGVMSQKFLLEHPFCPYGQTANLAIRRSIFLEVGLFRPYLTTGGDADICWRIQQETDWKLTFSPLGIIQHRHRSTLKEFRSQFKRYGQSNRYLHDLYGVDLMRDFTLKELSSRLSLWIFQEVPKTMIKIILGKANSLDLIKTPIDLLRFQARSEGQKIAKLPEEANKIVWS